MADAQRQLEIRAHAPGNGHTIRATIEPRITAVVPDERKDEFAEGLKELRRTHDVVLRIDHPTVKNCSVWMAGKAVEFDQPTLEVRAIGEPE